MDKLQEFVNQELTSILNIINSHKSEINALKLSSFNRHSLDNSQRCLDRIGTLERYINSLQLHYKEWKLQGIPKGYNIILDSLI